MRSAWLSAILPLYVAYWASGGDAIAAGGGKARGAPSGGIYVGITLP